MLQSLREGDIKPSWSMLRGEGLEGEDTQAAFQRIVADKLNINLKKKNIHPVYDYFHTGLNQNNYVYYAEVRKSANFKQLKEDEFSWVTFEQTVKFLFSAKTKQDVIVGERVIRLKERKDGEKEETSLSSTL